MSNKYDLVIKNARLILSDGEVNGHLGISDGKIKAVLNTGLEISGVKEVDAAGRTVTPGGIDTHTHISWPYDGKTTVDSAESASKVALLGGTTTVVDFVPPTDHENLQTACINRVDELSSGIHVDFALHPIIAKYNDDARRSIPAIINDGFTSFKMYTTYEDRRIDDGDAWYLMKLIAENGGLPGFHAENHELIASSLNEQERAHTLSIQDFAQSRPGLAEAEAIQMVSLYAKKLGCPVYIFHISGLEALNAVRAGRESGAQVIAETCTHYLVHDDSVFNGEDAWRFTITPPIRSTSDRQALLTALRDNEISCVGSDHCAYSTIDKRSSLSDHRQIPAGAPGIEGRTVNLWSKSIHDLALTRQEFTHINSERAAQVLGMSNKGKIAVGKDADLVIWDEQKQWSGSTLQRCSDETFNIYDQVHGTGLPHSVFLRGNMMVSNGDFVGDGFSGSFIRRSY